MKNLHSYVLCFVICMFILFNTSCEKETDENQPGPSELKLTPSQKSLISSNNTFGLKLFKEIAAQEEKDTNIFISPLSVAYALAMTYNGADGTTKEAMEETLELSGLTIEEINTSFKNLMNALMTLDDQVILTIANSIWYRDDFYVEPDFISVNEEYYNAEVAALDFSDPAAVTTINNWVADHTNNKITEIIQFIPPETVMYLINAIYFKGIWKYEFDESNTVEKPFFTESGEAITCSAMVQQSEFCYMKNDLFEAIELPYGKENFSMIILLPDQSKTVDDIIESLDNSTWNAWMSALSDKVEVKVSLPKLKVEYEKELKNILAALGMDIAFSPFEANFSKINPTTQLYISRVIHKTFLEVNEEGTEAAAVTAVEVGLTSIEPGKNVIYFNVNRPFILALREKSSNTILFMGSIFNTELEDE